MANLFATGNPLTAKLWSEMLYRDVMKDIFFSKFTGKGKENIIQENFDLQAKRGDKITFGLRMAMSGTGQESDTGITLQGNEEDLVFYDFSVTLTEAGHSTKAKSELDLQRPVFDLRTEMKDALKDWAAERLEKKLITALSNNPTAENYYDDTSADLSTNGITEVKVMARTEVSPKVRPVKVSGKERYVMLVHDRQAQDLKKEDAWRNAQRDAGVRGDENPIFAGMMGIWDNVVIHEYERVVLSSGSLARALLLGAQAGVIAYGHPFKWWEDMLDGNRIPWVGTTTLWQTAKTIFNGKDFGLITYDTKY